MTPARAAKIAVVASVHALSIVFFARAFLGPWSLAEVALGLLAGHLLIDFLTLWVHWTVDNYFAPDTPLIGSTVYYFREHHEKAYEMFQRDYVEGNFRNAAIPLVCMSVLLFLVDGCWGNCCVAWAGLMGAYITQIHKWAHVKRPIAPIALAQRLGLLVDWTFHNVHHGDSRWNYGLYAGWFDRLFDRLRVFETAERLVFLTTGHRAVESRLGFPDDPPASLAERWALLK